METQNKAEMDDIMSSFRVLYPNIVLEGDLCIIFGQSGIGKTIFAMQVAREIAAKGKRVLYLDFEMSERQLALRYNTPNFPPTFFRAELRTDNAVDNVLTEIERAAVENHAEVLFIDNITALGQSLDKDTHRTEPCTETLLGCHAPVTGGDTRLCKAQPACR